MVTGLSDFLFLHDSDLVSCMFLKLKSISSRLSNCWHIVIYIRLMILCVLSVVMSLFKLIILFVFVVRIAKGFSNLFIFSKNQLLV